MSARDVEVCPSSPKRERRMTMAIFLPSSVERAVEVVTAYFLEKRRSALPTPQKKRRMTMATFLLSTMESCEGRWPWPMLSFFREEEVCPSSPKKERVVTMVISFLSSVEGCGGDHGRSSRDEEVCSVSVRFAPKAADMDVPVRGRSHGLIIMANLAMAGGLPFYSYEGKEYDHGQPSAFLDRELWRWPMPSSSGEE